MNAFAVSREVGNFFRGIKCAILVRRSTVTMMVLAPFDLGRSTMKSIDTTSQGLFGIGMDANRPNGGFLESLLLAQISQEVT